MMMKKLPILLMLISGFALAATDITAIRNAAPETDRSMIMLMEVFGNSVFFWKEGAAGGGGGGLLPQVMLILNSAIFAVAILWLIYNLVAGVMQTAHEGEVLGKRFNSAWLPMRFSFGAIALVPAFGGYSIAQAIMGFGVLMGVGIANMATEAGIDMMASGKGLIAPPAVAVSETLFDSAFQSFVCMHGINKGIDEVNTAMPSSKIGPEHRIKYAGAGANGNRGVSATATEETWSFHADISPNEPVCGAIVMKRMTDGTTTKVSGILGNMGVGEADAAAKAIQRKVAEALGTAMSKLDTVAGIYVADFDANKAKKAIREAKDTYVTSIQTEVDSNFTKITGIEKEVTATLKKDGWIALGAFYNVFAVASAKINVATDVRPEITHALPPSYSAWSDGGYARVYAQAMDRLGDPALGKSSNPASNKSHEISSNAEQMSGDAKALNSIFGAHSPGQWFARAGIDLVAGGTGGVGIINPIMSVKSVGDSILTTVGYAYTALAMADLWEKSKAAAIAASAVTGAAAGAAWGSSQGESAGGAIGGAIGGAALAALATSGLIQPYLLVALGMGFMLSIYLPLTPFITWIGGIVSWFIIVCEAILAAPLWALTHMDTEGEGMGQKTAHGYIFFLNLVFRPVLMVIGFLFAGAAVIVLGTFVMSIFGVAIASLQMDGSVTGSWTGLFSILGFTIVFFALMSIVIHGCFNAIHIIPDQVIAWVGGHGGGAQMGKDAQQHGTTIIARSQGNPVAGQLGKKKGED